MKWYHYRYPVIVRKYLARIKFYLNPPQGQVADARKIEEIRAYAKKYRCRVFIETGTYLGGTVEALHDEFLVAHTIELDPWLYKVSKKRLAKYPNVVCHRGDSGTILKDLLPSIESSILFWLDAHYSRGVTEKGDDFTPIIRELKGILQHKYLKESVILIDDARCFNGTEDYPTIEYLKDFMNREWPAATVNVQDDIIRIHQ